MDLTPMLRAYCSDAAWALRLEDISGSIAVGKSADLIVLDRDLRTLDPMALHSARVMLTLLEGTPVYQDPAFAKGAAWFPAQCGRSRFERACRVGGPPLQRTLCSDASRIRACARIPAHAT
jgi:hypothetical protein